VVDLIPPELTCPDDITLERGDKICNDDVQNWLDSAFATDNCDTDVDIVNDAPECGFPYDSSTVVTWVATDDCGNTDECSAIITIEPPSRVAMTDKGSLLIFSKVDLRWNSAGELIQDTFLDITNDYPEDVLVQMYFFNGDPPLAASGTERAHLGHNWVDNQILLTANEPTYWSAATGQPKGVSPFTVLDPGDPPGRPAPDGAVGDRMLRGYVVGWAVNAEGGEIRFNHLKGDALIINYADETAWEYNAWTFSTRCVDHGAEALDCTLFDANGTCCEAEVIPGVMDMDAFQYDMVFGKLVLDFYAVGSPSLWGVSAIDTDLTLFPVDADLRQESEGVVTTKAHFDIWNMNEVKFSGTHRCITAWDQALLSTYDAPNHFLLENLHTDKGKARIDGVMSVVCDYSESAAILGVSAKMLTLDPSGAAAAAGMNLFGMGVESATIQADVVESPPPELRGMK